MIAARDNVPGRGDCLALASSSPRRAKILRDLGVDFEVVKTGAREVSLPHDPRGTVLANAVAKLQAYGATGRCVLAADTIVWLDGKIYGKPSDLDEAKSFLRELSGRTHQVFTGVAYFDGEKLHTDVSVSNVAFKALSDADIDGYIRLVNPIDRAGAYDIDDFGPLLIARFEGEYENVMGLPIAPLRGWRICD